jgi:hypothetical protein
MFTPAGKHMESWGVRKSQATAAPDGRASRAAAKAFHHCRRVTVALDIPRDQTRPSTRKDTMQRSSDSLAIKQDPKRRHPRLVRGRA